ncbi:MAG: DEAD/DEAH box helicase family protein [Verrucomicrobiales bacterium]|nr:DEAD/DEAH box helicase family protein [Verrucomicrobiales bacterium]
MHEAEWQTRKQRIDTRLRGLNPPWEIIPYQRQCLLATEAAVLAGRRELLVAMATGTGKTLLTVALIYRLLESRLARRILFLVDRKPLAAQAVREFHAFTTPQNRKFTQEYRALPTVLRLPRGTFTPYSQGVKANVVFFQKGRPTEDVWIFDARSNVPGITKKDRPLTAQHFAEFEAAYGKDPNGLSKRKDAGETGRCRRFRLSGSRARLQAGHHLAQGRVPRGQR